MNPKRILTKLDAVMVLMTTSTAPFSTAAVFAATGAWHAMSKEFCKMKKALLCALLVLAITCCSSALYAQMMGGPGQGGRDGHHRPMSPEDRLRHMTQVLNLTEDQQQKIKPILENESQQMQGIRQDTSLSHEERWSKMQQIRQNTNTQITPILNSDQQKKFEEMQSRHMGPPGSGAGTGTAPPAQPPQ